VLLPNSFKNDDEVDGMGIHWVVPPVATFLPSEAAVCEDSLLG